MYEIGYLDENNSIKKYDYNGTTIYENIKPGSIQKQSDGSYYFLSNSNKLCYYNGSTVTEVAENVKTFYATASCFLNNSGKLYYLSETDILLKDENVKSLYSDGTYIYNNNRISLNLEGQNIILDLENVTDYLVEKNQILMSDGRRIYNNIEVSDSGENWYQDEDGEIYFYAYSEGDIIE